MKKTRFAILRVFPNLHHDTNVICNLFIVRSQLFNNFFSQIVKQSVNAITLQFIG